MKTGFSTAKRAILLITVILLTLSTIGCGKNEIKRSKYGNEEKIIEMFCINFFNEENLPFTKLTQSDVQNTPDEYLFYVKGGIVYRTLNNSNVVITRREYLNENVEHKGINYSGEIYRIFEDDDADCLKIAASGEYALLANPSSIHDWDNDQVIASFMSFAADYEIKN